MRDIIWTIIGIWFVYKIYTEVIQPLLFRQSTQQANSNQQPKNKQSTTTSTPKEDKKQNLEGLGEYVDYEEIKD
jgi:hypothetical protein